MALLRDGFKTLIDIDGVTPTFEEIGITPPALDGAGSIDQTTMRNTKWRTAIGKSLVTLGNFSARVAYDPRAYAQLTNLLGQNRFVTVTFPDNSTLKFYAILNSFTPDEHTEGERPEATIEFIPSNLSTASPPVEVAPVFATGTTTTSTTTALPTP